MPNSVPEEALGPVRSVIEGAGVEGGSAIVSARPRRRAPRCPVCGRRCDGYDRLATRRWRATDLGASRCYLEYAPLRAGCPEHGAGAEAVPWARSAASRFASAFEDQVAWLAPRMRGSALAEPVRVDWHTVGGICPGVEASPGEADGRGRAGGLRPVGIDETSHERGHKHVTVVADHDRGRVVWAARGHGKAQMNAFLDLLTEEQRKGIEVVTADGARWIADVVAERLPDAELAVDPFHVVSWANDALDGPGRDAWREARHRPSPRRRRGRPRRGERPPADRAKLVRGLRFPLPENPEDLTEGQGSALAAPGRAGTALWRGYLPEEGLRTVFRADAADAAGELDRWLAWACRCRIPAFAGLSRKVRRKREGIPGSIELGVPDARVEAASNKIKVAIRQGYGSHDIDNLIALVMLRCSDLRPTLPGRAVVT